MKLHQFVVAVALTASGLSHAAKDDVLATVNGANLTQEMFDAYARQRGTDDAAAVSADRKQKLLEELINRELLYRAAEEKKLNTREDIAAELESARLNIMASAAVRWELEMKGGLTEEKLREGYDKFIKELPLLEYKTRHLLVDSEDKAKELIAELDKGADFAKLLSAHGAGAVEGGELDWFQPGDMLDSFADATMKLKKGEYTKTPVQTQYGWHVVQLQDTRKLTPPPFEEVKEQIRASTRNAVIEAYINGLRAKSKIEIK
jgi:peptidyl-prolyl cis-trans isomerase C